MGELELAIYIVENDMEWDGWTYEGPGPHEVGTMPGPQGRRTDIHEFVETLKSSGFAAAVLDHPSPFIKYHGGLAAYNFYLTQDEAMKWRDVHVEVMHGTTGVGKTRGAIEKAWQLKQPWFLMHKDSDKGIWWDGYTGQKTLILDEYHGNWMPYKAILGVLDGQPYRLPVKGSHMWAAWTTVIITSSGPPMAWYQREEYSELLRRINKITHIDPIRVLMPTEAALDAAKEKRDAKLIAPKAQSACNNMALRAEIEEFPAFSPEDWYNLNDEQHEIFDCYESFDTEMYDTCGDM